MGSPNRIMERHAPNHETVLARLPLLVLMAAERRGVNPSEILAAAKVDAEALVEEDARISRCSEQEIWREAACRTGGHLLGIEVIRNGPPGFLGLPELLFASASTLGEALDVAKRYMHLIHAGLSVGVEEHGDHATITYDFSEDASTLERGSVEYFLGAMAVMAGAYSGERPRIERFSLPHPALPKTQIAELVHLFGTERIEFGARRPSIVFDRSSLSRPFLGTAPRLHRVLRSHADLLLQDLPGQPAFLLRARQHLLA